MEEEPKKKIADATLQEALDEIKRLKLLKKKKDMDIADLKQYKNKIKSEKSNLNDTKTKRLRTLQESINKTATKSAKDSKRNSRETEKKSFESKIRRKEKEIETVDGKILAIESDKKQIDFYIEAFNQHIKTLK